MESVMSTHITIRCVDAPPKKLDILEGGCCLGLLLNRSLHCQASLLTRSL